MKDVGDWLGVKNVSDLVLKKIFGIYEKKNQQKKKLNVLKWLKEKLIKSFTNLYEDELNIKSNKSFYVKNNIMTNIIRNCKGEKRRGIRSIYKFRKQLIIPDHEISVSIEHVVKSKIEKTFVNEDILDEKSVWIYEIDLYFSEHYKKNTSW